MKGLPFAFDLPNSTAYAETCAAIALMLFSWRMLQYECDSKYADVMERTLFNGIISGISLDGKDFSMKIPWLQIQKCGNSNGIHGSVVLAAPIISLV